MSIFSLLIECISNSNKSQNQLILNDIKFCEIEERWNFGIWKKWRMFRRVLRRRIRSSKAKMTLKIINLDRLITQIIFFRFGIESSCSNRMVNVYFQHRMTICIRCRGNRPICMTRFTVNGNKWTTLPLVQTNWYLFNIFVRVPFITDTSVQIFLFYNIKIASSFSQNTVSFYAVDLLVWIFFLLYFNNLYKEKIIFIILWLTI